MIENVLEIIKALAAYEIIGAIICAALIYYKI